MKSVACLAFLFALGACQVDFDLSEDQLDDDQINTESQAVIGGTAAPNDPAVVQVSIGGLCTGSLVSPRVVMTAAHCVADLIEAGQTRFGSIGFGEGGGEPWDARINIVDMVMHRRYDPESFLKEDIAFVRMASPAPADIEPLPIRTEPLVEGDVGLQIRTVGFGHNVSENGETSGAGTKRQITHRINEVLAKHLAVGSTQYNTCQGDSGGPTFVERNGVEEVAGVTSYGEGGCLGTSHLTRTDVMWDSITSVVLNSWDGPCPNDGTCEEDCEVPDPDCDVCGFEGTCGTDCPEIDYDCPRGGIEGELCDTDFDCESRKCIESPEDSRVRYCSEDCAKDSDCPAPITVCGEDAGGQAQCMYSAVTPSVQGSPCQSGDDCRSGMCDTGDGICVEACSEAQECAAGYECQDHAGLMVCALPEDGGCGCNSGGSEGFAGSLLLLGSLLWTRRRRRLTARP
jgi:uncharacterized protein (TIGR03382 family)